MKNKQLLSLLCARYRTRLWREHAPERAGEGNRVGFGGRGGESQTLGEWSLKAGEGWSLELVGSSWKLLPRPS